MPEESADRTERDYHIEVKDGQMVINDELEVQVWLDDPTRTGGAERLLVEHAADAMIEGHPCSNYSPEGRPRWRPYVTVQLSRHESGDSDE